MTQRSGFTAPERPWRVAITGSSGLIGSALATTLEREGHSVLRVVRSPSRPGEVGWDPASGRIDAAALEGVTVVVNLAGENIGQRWNAAVKRRIRDSRVDGTRLLSRALASLSRPPDVLVNASATGYYGDRGAEILTEESPPGSDFLAAVVREWEGATTPATAAGVRVVLARFGLALTPRGGVLGRMLPAFQLGAGGRLADGDQWVSWIAIDDLVDAIRFVIGTPSIEGPVHLVAPEPVTNAELTDALGKALRRPTVMTVPKPALQLLFGEMAGATLLASQRAIPARLQAAGFEFRHPRLPGALRAVLDSGGSPS